MFTHNLDPVLFDLGFISIRWYSLAYIFGILIGWWYGKKIIIKRFNAIGEKFKIKKFDDLITYLIVGLIIGGRAGYVVFYNLEYYIENPSSIIKIWEGGMSFHGGLIGIVVATYFFSQKENIKTLFLLDIIACVAPIGIFLGRIANFINGELVGKVSEVPWGIVFPNIDNMNRHPSQLYEALLEGAVLFIIMNKLINTKNYVSGTCSYYFLIFYGSLRIFSEIFREPDVQIGYILNFFSIGTLLSLIMVLTGILLMFSKKNEY